MAKNEDRRKDAQEFILESSQEPLDDEVVEQLQEEQKKEHAAGQAEAKRKQYTSTSPELSGGDVDARWQEPDVGEETVGGDVATPDQDVTEEIGSALGVTYQDNEPLRGANKIHERDRERWELDPASSEDYEERSRRKKP